MRAYHYYVYAKKFNGIWFSSIEEVITLSVPITTMYHINCIKEFLGTSSFITIKHISFLGTRDTDTL